MIGCGNMGGALLAQWMTLPDLSVTVVDPGTPNLPTGVRHVADASSLAGEQFDCLIVAVKPQLIDLAVPPAAGLLSSAGCAVSIAAGTSTVAISKACAGAPAIRLMPNMPARIGQGVSGLYAQPSCTQSHRSLADRLAQAAGSAVWVNEEDAIDRFTAAAGSGPGYVFEFARCYAEAIATLGFSPAQARQLAADTIVGSLALARETGEPFDALRDSIMSKGGTTAAGVAALNDDGALSRHLEDAVQAAYRRAVELRG